MPEEFSGSIAGSVFHESDATDHEEYRDCEVGQAFYEVGADPPGFRAVGPEYAVHVQINNCECGNDAEVENIWFLFHVCLLV